MSLLVAVPTFRRQAWLPELLDVLVGEADDLGEEVRARIVLLDNDPDTAGATSGAARAAAAAGAEYRAVALGNVVGARNAAIELALAEDVAWLVMLDDDELPQPGWLRHLRAAAQRWHADVVAGPVRQEPAALRRSHVAALLSRDERPGGPFDGDVGAGNVMIRTDLLRRTGIRFDQRLGATGGEDTLFFRQAARAGARLVWAPDAVVVERAVPARLTRRRLLARSMENGRSSVLVDEALGEAVPRWRRGAVLLAAAGVYLPRAAVHLAGRDPRAAWRRVHQVARHVGRWWGPAATGRYGGRSESSGRR